MMKKFLQKIYNKLNEAYSKKETCKAENLEKIKMVKEYCIGKQRCFIIGNGPSLTKEDLDLLKEEVTFVCNRFYNFYDGWKPTFYFCQDPTILKNNLPYINSYSAEFKMVSPHIKMRKEKYSDDSIFYSVIRNLYYDRKAPLMSKSFENGIYDGYTVTYSMIQAAVLFGFKEIYLLGVDFNYVIKDGKIDESSYPKGTTKTKGGGLPDLNYNLLAFKTALDYCDKNGITIVNLSRNTKLDIFKRDDIKNIIYGEDCL